MFVSFYKNILIRHESLASKHILQKIKKKKNNFINFLQTVSKKKFLLRKNTNFKEHMIHTKCVGLTCQIFMVAQAT